MIINAMDKHKLILIHQLKFDSASCHKCQATGSGIGDGKVPPVPGDASIISWSWATHYRQPTTFDHEGVHWDKSAHKPGFM